MTKNLLACLLIYLISGSPSAAVDSQIRIATINIGMLNIGKPVPFIEERQDILGHETRKILEQSNIDILAIQELWTAKAISKLKNAHPDYVLLNFRGDNGTTLFLDHPTGLAFLVKKSLKGKVDFKDFETGESYHCGFGLICNKGLLIFTFDIEGKKIAVLNTHLTASWRLRSYRKAQLLEAREFIIELVKEKSISVALLAGDLNLSPSYGKLRKGDNGPESNFMENAQMYRWFFEKNSPDLHCKDSFSDSISKPNYAYSYNRETNHLALVKPNSSYEPSQRVDHIFLCGKSTNWKVQENTIVFDKPVKHSRLGHPIHLSDHYGVLSIIKLL